MKPPEQRRVYQNHHLDSTRWDYFEQRPGDIVISTSYKAGTTWMQAIIGNLLYPDSATPVSANQLSPWLDSRNFPLEMGAQPVAGAIESSIHQDSSTPGWTAL